MKAAANSNAQVIGLEDSFDGLIEPGRARPLTPRDVTGILRVGGTILGTTNRGNPFAYPVDTRSAGTVDYSDRCLEMYRDLQLDAVIVIGGDGTLAIAHEFQKRGMPIVGVPKTIDNDIVLTNSSFGFDSAVSFATDAIDRLHTTAEAHHRIMVVEVMGRYAGWIAINAGIAGGADVILIPEIPYDIEKVAARITERDHWGAKFSIVVAAEGAKPIDGEVSVLTSASAGRVERLGGIGGASRNVSSAIPEKRHAASYWATSSAAARPRASTGYWRLDWDGRRSNWSCRDALAAWSRTIRRISAPSRSKISSAGRSRCRSIPI